jgi:hypothetical protein
LCAYLNKSSVSIRDNSTLFDIRAETHIAKSINNIDARSYILANLLGINIASREAKPLGFRKQTIAYATDSRETHTLRLSKV